MLQAGIVRANAEVTALMNVFVARAAEQVGKKKKVLLAKTAWTAPRANKIASSSRTGENLESRHVASEK
jgi:hypothetical protein